MVDSGISYIGLLVWMGKNSGMDERRKCIERAELLLREKKNCAPRPVSSHDNIIQYSHPGQFTILL